MKKLVINLVVVAPVIASFVGCAGYSPRDAGFYQRAVQVQDAVPIPVEIARDIERITEDGVLVLNNSKFSKTASAYSRRIMEQKRLLIERECKGLIGAALENCQNSFYNDDNYSVIQTVQNEIEFDQENAGPLLQANSDGGKGPLKFNRRSYKRGTASGFGQGAGGSSGLEPLTGGETVNYIVKLGDTLMKIAFEKYANYLRWRDIYKVNQGKMESPEKMRVGTELTIENVKYVYIKKDGRPYLIRKNDTLKSISEKLYGTPDKWKDIWKNNPQLVRNPKKIYTGFTLYYQSENKDDMIQNRLPTKVKDSDLETN